MHEQQSKRDKDLVICLLVVINRYLCKFFIKPMFSLFEKSIKQVHKTWALLQSLPFRGLFSKLGSRLAAKSKLLVWCQQYFFWFSTMQYRSERYSQGSSKTTVRVSSPSIFLVSIVFINCVSSAKGGRYEITIHNDLPQEAWSLF